MIRTIASYRVSGVLALFLIFLFILSSGATAQPIGGQQFVGSQAGNSQFPGANTAPAQSIRPDYVLGANDQILIRVPQEEQINERPFRIDSEGFINLPVAGRIRADGLTVQALEQAIAGKLREFIRDPLVSITVVQFRSEPVFFVGAFRAPGIYGLQGRRTLVEMLATVGGLMPNASRRLKVVRRTDAGNVSLPNGMEDLEKKTSTLEISLQSLTENINPAEDIVLQAYDVVSVERSERVYVTGEVGKVAAIELAERDSISVAQALTEAGGFTPNAIRDRVRVLRPILGTNRRAEFEIDMKRVFEGKEIDFPLLPNDVLYVPRSGAKSFALPLATTLIGSVPYVIITALLR